MTQIAKSFFLGLLSRAVVKFLFLVDTRAADNMVKYKNIRHMLRAMKQQEITRYFE